MSTFVSFRDANFTNEEGAGKILAKIVGQSVVVGAETSHRVEEKGGGADDTVDVQVGQVIILDDDGFGIRAWSDAIENLPVTSNSSGNPRIDVVVAYIDKAVEDIGANNSPDGLVFAIVDGTPAGAPTPPNDATIQAAVGADNPFIKLAQIAVADSFVSITNSEITDLREQFSIQSGGKKLQYDVANNIWTLEDSLEVETAIKVDTVNEKNAGVGVTVDGLEIKDSTLQRFTEGDVDFVASGGVWSADDLGNDLLASMTALVIYINGVRLTVSIVTARAFTASKDTYVDIGSDGTIDYNEVANDASPPALAADHARLAVVVTGASTASLDDLRNLSSINKLRVSLKLSAVQSIPHNATTAINWDEEEFDFGALHDNITNKSRITIPSGGGGIYLISFFAIWGVNNTGERLVYIFKNNATALVQDRRAAISRSDCSISILKEVEPGDFFEAFVKQQSGSALDFVGSARFSAIKLA